MHDIIIIGGGPAGLTAAIYAGRAGKSALIIEKNAFGGQMTYSPKIENYPGVPAGAGMGIADTMVEQVLSQGIDTEFDTIVDLVKNADGTFTAKGEFAEYAGKSVIVAVGCKHRRLGLEGEDDLIGDGISFCAICDGAFYKDQSVIMVGGGNSALQEAILLSETSTKVTIVQNLPYFTGEAKLAEQVNKRDNIEVIFGAVADSLIVEDGKFKGLNIKSDSGEVKSLYADGMFVAIGLQPENQPFASLAALNSYGYFDTDESCVTATEGLFVAGDCRSKRIRQVTTATADGAVAALAACRYLDN
jgi:thioredoxin reductase (NADPH)